MHRRAVGWLLVANLVGGAIVSGVILAGAYAKLTAIPPTVIGPMPPAYWPARVVEVVTTGYNCPSGGRSNQCDKGIDDGLTATLEPVRRGICAADIGVHPYKTILLIPGYGPCVVEDIGSKITGNRVDLYFASQQAALEWGVRQQQALVLPPDWERDLYETRNSSLDGLVHP